MLCGVLGIRPGLELQQDWRAGPSVRGTFVWAAHCSMKLNMNFYCTHDDDDDDNYDEVGDDDDDGSELGNAHVVTGESNCSAGQGIKYYETYFSMYAAGLLANNR